VNEHIAARYRRFAELEARERSPLYEAFAYRRQPFTQDEVEGPITMEVVPYVRP